VHASTPCAPHLPQKTLELAYCSYLSEINLFNKEYTGCLKSNDKSFAWGLNELRRKVLYHFIISVIVNELLIYEPHSQFMNQIRSIYRQVQARNRGTIQRVRRAFVVGNIVFQ